MLAVPNLIKEQAYEAVEAGNAQALKKAIESAFKDTDEQLTNELSYDYGLQCDGSTACVVVRECAHCFANFCSCHTKPEYMSAGCVFGSQSACCFAYARLRHAISQHTANGFVVVREHFSCFALARLRRTFLHTNPHYATSCVSA